MSARTITRMSSMVASTATIVVALTTSLSLLAAPAANAGQVKFKSQPSSHVFSATR